LYSGFRASLGVSAASSVVTCHVLNALELPVAISRCPRESFNDEDDDI